MPMTKLTLSADRELIREAKRLAAQEGTSLSGLFSRMLRSMARARAAHEAFGPLTRKATGLVRLPDEAQDEQLLEDALARKHAVRG